MGGRADSGNLSDQVVNSALRYRAQAPLLDQLLSEVGLSGTDINGLTQALRPKTEAPIQAEVVVKDAVVTPEPPALAKVAPTETPPAAS